MSSEFDIVVAGGGAAGAVAAGLLGRQGFRTALVDLRAPRSPQTGSNIDPRVVAISPGSRNILQAAGAWKRLDPERFAPYDRMQVASGSGLVGFDAAEHGLDALGWIVELPAIAGAAWADLEARGEVEIIAPARIESVELGCASATLHLDGGRRIETRVLVAADGARSRLRAAAGIQVKTWHYNQKAVVTHLETAQPNPGLAWQRFTASGPLALLPLPGGRSSLVWSVPDRHAASLLRMPEGEFLAELADYAIDPPFGAFTATARRHALPLIRRQAETLHAGPLVLLGDAARTVHPLAGQGLNLGLIDAATLCEALDSRPPGAGKAHSHPNHSSPDTHLARYSRRRMSNGALVAGGIHAFSEITAAGGAGAAQVLGLGFGLVDRLWPARELFVRRACGLDAAAPELAQYSG